MDKSAEEKMIARINELYHKKQKTGLTAQEASERKELQQKFIKNFRASFKQDIEDMVILDKDGKEVTSEKAKQAQRKKGLRKS